MGGGQDVKAGLLLATPPPRPPLLCSKVVKARELYLANPSFCCPLLPPPACLSLKDGEAKGPKEGSLHFLEFGSKASDLVLGLVIFAFGMPWLSMWVGKSVWGETRSFLSMIGFYPATVAAFQKMERIRNRAKLLDRHPPV